MRIPERLAHGFTANGAGATQEMLGDSILTYRTIGRSNGSANTLLRAAVRMCDICDRCGKLARL